MNQLIKKIHTYAGLLTFTILIVFGITGLVGTFRPPPQERPTRVFEASFMPFTVPESLTDREVADLVYESLKPPLTAPPPDGALQRDERNNLRFNLYTVNGPQRLTVLEKENQLKFEVARNSIWQYFEVLHETSMRARPNDLRVRLWGYYNEFSVWSLMVMALTGLYLWLSSRPRYQLAQGALIVGSGVFLLLYFWAR